MQGTKLLLNNDQTRYQNLALQSSQSQKPRCHHKSTIINSQDNISPLEPSNSTKAGPEDYKIAEAHEKELKTAFMKMIEVLNEEMNKSLKEIYENTNKQ